MRSETYGDHAEAAACDLSRLVVEDDIPSETEDIDQLLHCREIVIDAIRQRLYGFGLNTDRPLDKKAVLTYSNLTEDTFGLVTLMSRVVGELPRLPPDHRAEPLQILGRASSNLTVERWRRVASELLAGSHALDTAADRPWLTDFGAGWFVIRDVAAALEAFVVLDDRLDQVGLLTRHDRPAQTLGLEARRLTTSQCSRIASWHATNDLPDQAAPRPSGDSAVVDGVRMVTTPSDLAASQQHLGAQLRPLHNSNALYDGEPEISADAARQIVASQLFLNTLFARMASMSAKTQPLRAQFEARSDLLQEIQPQLRHLIDVQHNDPNRHRMWQQTEITTAVRRMQRDRVQFTLPPPQILTLANATHEVSHNLAQSLRRELLRDDSNLRIADITSEIGATRVRRYHPLERSLTDLVSLPPPTAPVISFNNPRQREALRRTLDVTPSQPRAPRPFPNANSRSARSTPR